MQFSESILYSIILQFLLKMSSQDQDFQLLVSTQDYIKLQSQCQLLQKLKEQLQDKNKSQLADNRALSTKVFDLREEVERLSSNEKRLNEEIVVLKERVEKLGKVETEHRKVQDVLQKNKRQNENMSKQIEIKDITIKTLQNQIAKLRQEKDRLVESNKQQKVAWQIQRNILCQRYEKQNKQILESSKLEIEQIKIQLQQQIQQADFKIKNFEQQKNKETQETQQMKENMIMEVKVQVEQKIMQLIEKEKKLVKLQNDLREVYGAKCQLEQSIEALKMQMIKILEDKKLADVSLIEKQEVIIDLSALNSSLQDKIKHLELTCLQCQRKSNQLAEKMSQMNDMYTSKEKQFSERVNNQEQVIIGLKAQNCSLQDKIRHLEQACLQNQVERNSLVEKMHQLSDMYSAKQKKLSEQLKNQVLKFEQRISLKTQTIQQLQLELQTLKKQMNEQSITMHKKIEQKQNQLQRQKTYQALMQKQYQNIIIQIQEENKQTKLKVQKKEQKDQLKEVKELLKQYFGNMTKSLIEIGNLDSNEIKTILSQQQEIVKQYVIDIAQPFVENKQGK